MAIIVGQDSSGIARTILTDSNGKIITSSNSTEEFSINDVDDASSTTSYIGLAKSDGTWLIRKVVDSTTFSIRYANVSNNSSYTDYSTAWTNRASLTYEQIEELTL